MYLEGHLRPSISDKPLRLCQLILKTFFWYSSCNALVMDVQIYRGKEMEAVLDMLPYMRLAHLSDPDEMETVSFAQGPVCPVSYFKFVLFCALCNFFLGLGYQKLPYSWKRSWTDLWINFVQVSACNERAVLDQLEQHFERRLAGYKSSNVSEVSIADHFNHHLNAMSWLGR